MVVALLFIKIELDRSFDNGGKDKIRMMKGRRLSFFHLLLLLFFFVINVDVKF